MLEQFRFIVTTFRVDRNADAWPYLQLFAIQL
jgi:hypothetical protein